MIHVGPEQAVGDGSVPVYMDFMPQRGDTVAVVCDGVEGFALVANPTMIMSGSRYLVYLDVDWSSFDRFPDGE